MCATQKKVRVLISLTGAQGDLINNNYPELDPSSLGLPPDVSREGLPNCDEYSPNYETPCTAKGSHLTN